jgi:hypothetical protein
VTQPYEPVQSGVPASDVVVIEEIDDEQARDVDDSDVDDASDMDDANDIGNTSDIDDASDEPSLTVVSDESGLGTDGYEPSHAADDAEPGLAVSREWQDIQALFVDDPRGAVELAAAAADAAVSALMTALREQQAALTPAANTSADATPTDPGQTEQLRAALRGYRSLCQNLDQVGTSLSTATPT